MRIYHAGSELPTYRNLIKEMNVSSSLSYLGLNKRIKKMDNWDIRKYFPAEHHLFVDSGCQVLNNAKEEKYTQEELREIANQYYDWIDQRNGDIDLFSEFDALQLGRTFLQQARARFLGNPNPHFLPIWHPDEDNGIEGLRILGDKFGRVGIVQTSLGGRDLLPVLSRMAASGIALHGLAMTKPDIMQAVNWTSVSSTSWTTPQRYGDTIVWSHGQLKRYPKSMKLQGRKKERQVIINAGFDYDKIQADDPKELLRLSLWSWTQLENKINKKTTGVTQSMNSRDEEFSENDYDDVGTVAERPQKRVPTARARNADEKTIVPFLHYTVNTDKDPKTNADVERSMVHVRSDSMRICDTCFLAPKCPMFEENATCAYDIPIQVETQEQMKSLMNALVSMQTQRVVFAKMAEDLEGSGIDPILSAEMDRLGKLIEKKHNIEQEGFSLTVTAKQQGKFNSVGTLFGDMTNYKFGQLEAPVPVQDAAELLGIEDAEIEWER